MARCKDCIYSKMCHWVGIVGEETPCKYFIDTADVVPKSEVENCIPTDVHEALKQRAKDEVAREIFEEFRTEMRSRLNSCDELYKKDPDDFYGGQTWAYSSAIFVLENIIKKYTEGKNENT